jgi:hypothetical protein
MEIMTIRHLEVSSLHGSLFRRAVAGVLALLLCSAQEAESVLPRRGLTIPKPELIVEKADLVRFPAEGFQVDIRYHDHSAADRTAEVAQVPRALQRQQQQRS